MDIIEEDIIYQQDEEEEAEQLPRRRRRREQPPKPIEGDDVLVNYPHTQFVLGTLEHDRLSFMESVGEDKRMLEYVGKDTPWMRMFTMNYPAHRELTLEATGGREARSADVRSEPGGSGVGGFVQDVWGRPVPTQADSLLLTSQYLKIYFLYANGGAKSRCAIVTGGNRGIGLEICRQLALNGVKVILTSRNQSRGEEVVKKLNVSGLSNVIFHQLDINDPSSIACLAEFVQTHFGKLDILINNAAEIGLIIHEKEFVAGGGFLQVVDEKADILTNIVEEPYEVGEKCLKTNFYATKAVTESLIPLLQLSKSPRIVNVSSIYGDLCWFHNEKLKEELNDVDNLTEERIDEIIQWFLSDFKAGKLRENGWPLTVSAYKVSKAVLNAYTRLLARKYKSILVNCVHPGYVMTDMTSQTGLVTVEQGAKGPVMAALLPDDGPSGVYFNQTQIAPLSSSMPAL
ncbi:short-chain dehydrogenase/reductase 1-like [Bidens hawaiensis]|uniref:short-chain dehydrogenase/reductase 1-like n=1 Tax=Bidens hawaiensis TaxID=980011 RepID=UPI004049FB1D